VVVLTVPCFCNVGSFSACQKWVVGSECAHACRERKLQYFWEVFPAQDGLTTYMFAYTDPTPGRALFAILSALQLLACMPYL
jgi:hypothetical protein